MEYEEGVIDPLPASFGTSALARIAGSGARAIEVFAREGRLYVDGKPLEWLHAYTLDRVAEPEEPNTVRVVGKGFVPLVDIDLPTTREAEALLERLGADAPDRTIATHAGRVRPGVGVLGTTIFVAMLLPLLTSHGLPPLGGAYGWFFLTLFLGLATFLVGRRRAVTVDRDGATLGGMVFPTHVAWRWLEGVDRVGENEIRIRHAPPRRALEKVFTALTQDEIYLQIKDTDARDALFYLLLRRRLRALRALERPAEGDAHADATSTQATNDGVPQAENEEVAGLARRLAADGRDTSAWLAALRGLVPRESYRIVTPSDAALGAVARDVDLPPDARVAASFILAERGERAPTIHPRVDASPRVRIALTERDESAIDVRLAAVADAVALDEHAADADPRGLAASSAKP